LEIAEWTGRSGRCGARLLSYIWITTHRGCVSARWRSRHRLRCCVGRVEPSSHVPLFRRFVITCISTGRYTGHLGQRSSRCSTEQHERSPKECARNTCQSQRFYDPAHTPPIAAAAAPRHFSITLVDGRATPGEVVWPETSRHARRMYVLCLFVNRHALCVHVLRHRLYRVLRSSLYDCYILLYDTYAYGPVYRLPYVYSLYVHATVECTVDTDRLGVGGRGTHDTC
jgi:hypothetical protein